MKKTEKVIVVMAVMALCWIMAWASNAEYNHTVVGNMSEERYNEVLAQMAEEGIDNPSEAEIVEWIDSKDD